MSFLIFITPPTTTWQDNQVLLARRTKHQERRRQKSPQQSSRRFRNRVQSIETLMATLHVHAENTRDMSRTEDNFLQRSLRKRGKRGSQVSLPWIVWMMKTSTLTSSHMHLMVPQMSSLPQPSSISLSKNAAQRVLVWAQHGEFMVHFVIYGTTGRCATLNCFYIENNWEPGMGPSIQVIMHTTKKIRRWQGAQDEHPSCRAW